MMLSPHVVTFDAINRDELNGCLIAWGHKMGPWNRPNYGDQCFHGLRHNDRLVAVTAAAGLIRPQTCGLTRADACELGRGGAERRDLCRVALRLWREFVFPALCVARGWSWAISYQDAFAHSGDLYRFDGWIVLGRTRSGTDARSGKRGRNKVVWGWHADPLVRRQRRIIKESRAV
jgi:antitoxin VapB